MIKREIHLVEKFNGRIMKNQSLEINEFLDLVMPKKYASMDFERPNIFTLLFNWKICLKAIGGGVRHIIMININKLIEQDTVNTTKKKK